jgi:pimeloyl-ACP methyl ester carboxylesterase
MAETIGLTTRSGLTFTADVAGPVDGPLVLLLHGFPESRHSWREALPELAKAGYRAVAPDQRGYSPGARPDPVDLSNYAFDKLVNDALEIAAAAGCEARRFHLVGHDWGGQVSWGVANTNPQRLASLTVLSRPHPLAFRRALQDPKGDQKHRSRHHGKFLEPETGRLLTEDNAKPSARRACSGRACSSEPRSGRACLRAGQSARRSKRRSPGIAPTRGWPADYRDHHGADALHLGRRRRDGRARRGLWARGSS